VWPLDFWIESLNTVEDVCSLVSVLCCVRSGLCEYLITRSEESYLVCVCVI